MLEIWFLGTSAGIPSPERGMPSIALRWGGSVFLWDAGEGCQRQLMKYKVGYGSIRNIFITHTHLDHFLGFYGLIETLRMTTSVAHEDEGLKVYAPGRFSNLLINKWNFLKVNRLKQGVMLKGNDFEISAFKVRHEGDSYGFVFKENDKVKFNAKKAEKLGIKGRMFSALEKRKELKIGNKVVKLKDVSFLKPGRKIVYSGDTMYSDNLVKVAKDADMIIHECTFDESMQNEAEKRRHSSVKDAALAAERANAKTLVLTHISARYTDQAEELAKQAKKHFKGNVVVASDGMKIEL